jgi:predicted glycoside hydrolase/deacetylase ChbG (UPF0249 family)
MSSVLFCADDYALNAPISQAILQLLDDDRLQATSCMTQAADWPAHGALLRALKQRKPQIQVGLHFNLTHDFQDELPFLPLGQLMLTAWMRVLPKAWVNKSLAYQWQRFVDVMGCPPDYVDGHQHVHQFPIVRTVLTDFLANHSFSGWVRNLSQTIPTQGYMFKSSLLPRLGAGALARLCTSLGIAQNQRFAGIYDFSDATPYETLMQRWLDRANPQGHLQLSVPAAEHTELTDSLLIMCHPALDNSDLSDSIASARVREYAYLASPRFAQDCVDRQLTVNRVVYKNRSAS